MPSYFQARPSPPSKAVQKRKQVNDQSNSENAPAASSAGPTPTKKPKKGLTGTPMKMLSNLKINTPKTKLKLKAEKVRLFVFKLCSAVSRIGKGAS